MCRKEEDIQKVKDIIKAMDDYEYSYLPDDFIQVFEPIIKNASHSIDGADDVTYYVNKYKYTHKFDSLDINELLYRCWANGIKCFTCMNNEEVDIYHIQAGENLASTTRF